VRVPRLGCLVVRHRGSHPVYGRRPDCLTEQAYTGRAVFPLPDELSWTAAATGMEMLADPEHPVTLYLLGCFRLLKNGELVAVRSGGKTEALLAYLGLSGASGVPREVLLRMLWPSSEK